MARYDALLVNTTYAVARVKSLLACGSKVPYFFSSRVFARRSAQKPETKDSLSTLLPQAKPQQ